MTKEIYKTQTELDKVSKSVKQIRELKRAIAEVAASSKNVSQMRETIRDVQMDIRLVELDVSNRLKKQALDEWNRLPENERYRKKGFFGREEDLTKRELFVQRYIEDNLAGEMAKEKR